MAALPYTRRLLVQRIRKHITNDRATNDSFQASDREILLLIDQEAAVRLVGQAYEGAKIEGNLVVPDAYYTTYVLPALVYDTVHRNWTTTLPQPPMSLPLGYSISRTYFANTVNGDSKEILPIKAKRVSFRNLLPMPRGARYSVEGNKIIITANDGSSLLNQQVYVSMATARTENWDDIMHMPEDDISFIFGSVVKLLMQRYGMPFDQIKDDLPAGNKPV